MKTDPFCTGQGRIKGGRDNGATAPGSPLQGDSRWWHLFLLNNIFFWKIVVIHRRYKNRTLYSDVALSIINDFSASLTFRQFGNHYSYFRFVQCKYISSNTFVQCKCNWILLVTCPNNRSFRMGLSTRARTYCTNVAKTILSACLRSKASSAMVAV